VFEGRTVPVLNVGGWRFESLQVLPEPPVSADPGEEPLDYPSARVDRDADLIGGPF
jgi:hypothetical protein